MSSETIFASATGAGRAAVAVIRLSGPMVGAVLARLAGRVPEPRFAHYARLADPRDGETIDRGLVLYFPQPNSPTGEDYAELQIHGGRAVTHAVLRVLGDFPGLREAQPGEFARRSLANGKMDLSQVEGLADLIEAETEFQRRQAIRALGGALRKRVESWRERLIRALALVEAELDFSDEGDVFEPATALRPLLEPLGEEMAAVLKTGDRTERLRDGYVVLLLGAPNSGKSTLLNALAQREVAIVSPVPGTTRDMIEVHLDLGGMPVTLVDTAGLREATDEIERIGVARTRARIGEADLLVWLSEGGVESPREPIEDVEFIRVATKADLLNCTSDDLAISARTGFGIERLLEEMADRAKRRLGDGSTALLTRERHRRLVQEAKDAIEACLDSGKPLEFVADDLRIAGRALGRIVGAVDVEDVLDAIFSQFCIGK
ncbi:tRNA uridine-5-carboxymethylaminomethyl(34) synthesis GTPase MnmE [Methylosinus sp. H3A]|uniref:tRNA uridine-5-carboxymethylaminomethyl(34) synthesis GTPase MnmE n=1 Tax=Methylosinus sp. H3A TaxID=2785786 RepID=UPI0018C2B8CB|nr:tRNA uridine-5-carboxymethylaminomethyl(34) synthesis GTPase MnmE [Methylosinus sp. H3A]MBG0809608.1 tRNA uridine-5-carboxymethylaminomethyl(34) synthesis GTPase MnmE [Methylosinus sp. H3A]